MPYEHPSGRNSILKSQIIKYAKFNPNDCRRSLVRVTYLCICPSDVVVNLMGRPSLCRRS